MRRLVDETTDELTRSLLSAGIEHQPPPGNKARVLIAIGAGGALGLFSSNALAWVSTTTGKLTALGVAVGVAGAVWIAVPPAREARSSRDAAGAQAAAQAQALSAADAVGELEGGARVEGSAATDGASKPGRTAESSGNDALRGSEPELEEPAASAVAGSASAESSNPSAALSVNEGRKASAARRERGKRKRAVRKSSAQETAAASRASEGRGDERVSALEAPSTVGALVAPVDLDSEVRLVDDMHSAARRNDRAALGRFLERYRTTFPDGQLKKEVAEFAARLDSPDISDPR